MDGNLFKKYEHTINKAKQEKQTIITYIQERTGVLLEEKEITIQGKKVLLQTTSTKRFLLTTKNIKSLLEEKKYIFKG